MNLRNTTRLLFALLFLSILTAAAGLPVLARSVSPTASQQLEKAWRRAVSAGRYTYRSTIVQTLHPTARIENAGRAATVQRLTVTGQVDAPADTLTMRIRQGGEQSRQFIDLKFEQGRTYGRVQADADWAEIEERTDLFTPGGDLMGFLNAAQGVRVLEAGEGDDLLFDELLQGEQTAGLTRYVFALDGLRYAQYLRDQMEAVLRRKGELAGNMHLALARTYLDMAGSGELWVAEGGLPVRLVIHMELPPDEDTFVWKEVTITTGFSDWQAAPGDNLARLWRQPSLLFADPGVLAGLFPPGLQQMSLTLTALGLLLLLTWLVIRHRRSPRLYVTVVASMILALVAGPLLQSQQVSGASRRFSERQLRTGAQQAEMQMQPQESAFDPLRNPLADADKVNWAADIDVTNTELAAAAPVETVAQRTLLQATNQCDTATDRDCDTVPDAEDDYPDDPNEWADSDGDGIANGVDPDDDNDGLNDDVEVLELGTLPNFVDSDGDLISDYAEVTGFIVGGKTWYLDPNNPDSNDDGLSDAAECPELINVNAAGKLTTPVGTACRDTDGDGTPDVFDFDNDNDGVPDRADLSPNYTGELSTVAQTHFNLALSEYETGKPLMVEFQVRPTDTRHLWYNGNVLDWPANDRAGQIRRLDDSTFLDEGIFADSPQAANGDMMLQAMLELKLPYSAGNPTRGLPTNGTTPAATTPIADWLDQATLSRYGISVAQDLSDGRLTVYLPLHAVSDPYAGDSPVAWSGRMFYHPLGADWGAAHSVRLLWSVIVLSDSCDVPSGQDYDQWCADDANWTTSSSVAQTYYDDFYLTGLAVQEDHGMKSAVIAQNNAAAVPYENYLWHLSDALDKTFLRGQTVTAGGSRFDIDAIVNQFGPAAGGTTVWGVPTGQLNVVADGAASQTDGLTTLMNQVIPNLLASSYPNPPANFKPSLLILREYSQRSTALGHPTAFEILSGSAGTTVQAKVGQTTLDTYATLQLTPYEHDGVGWVSENPIGYLDTLELALDNVLTSAMLQTFFTTNEVADEDLARLGVVGLAKNYYISLAYGTQGVVAIDGVAASIQPIDAGQVTLAAGAEAVLEVVGDILDLLIVLSIMQSYAMQNNAVAASAAYHPLTDRNSVATTMGAIEVAYASDAIAGGIKETAALAKLLLKEFAKKPLAAKLFGPTSSTIDRKTILSAMNLSAPPSEDAGWWDWLKTKATDYVQSNKGKATILAAASASVKAIGAEEGWDPHVTYGIATGLDVAAGVYGIRGALDTYQALQATSRVDAIFEISELEAGLWGETVAGYGITYGVGIVLDWALFAYTVGTQHIGPHSMAFGPLLAETIAKTLLLDAEFLLSILLPGIGELIVAVVTALDALIADICKLAGVKSGSDVDTWVCGGITGAITESIVKLIFDQYVIVDLSDKHRLELELQNPAVVALTDTGGFATGNQLQVTARITNTIKEADPSGLGSAEDKAFETQDFAHLLISSAFSYTVESEDQNHTSALHLGDVAWHDTSDAQKKYAVFTVTGRGDFATTGINQTTALFLNESWHIPGIECWGVVIQGCGRKDVKSYNPVNLGDSFIFDLFPTTFDEFYTLYATGDASYRLAWDARFPTLADADGDGLRSRAVGGLDPDDSTADGDEDGLSDRYEKQIGTDPALADTDGDGLSDYWELFYRTNPLLPDSDFDGLLDGDEFFHSGALHAGLPDDSGWRGGWSFVYTFDSNNHPLSTWVSSNPLSFDTDGDGILDERERVYGYNPNVPSVLNVLTLDATTDAGTVAPGATIEYVASVKNELRGGYEAGLLQTEFPVDTVVATQEIGILNPQQSVTVTGAVHVPAQVVASYAASMTVRAGAEINQGTGHVLWLRMNEARGSSEFRDSSYNDHHATCIPQPCPAANGSTLQFGPNVDGVGSRLTVPDTPDLDLTNFTIALRVYPTQIKDAWQPLVTKQEELGARRNYGIYLRPNTLTPHFTMHDGNCAALIAADSTGSLLLNRWNHVAVTFDGAHVSFYINGTPQGTQDYSGAPCLNDDPVRIGSVTGNFFQGYMDELEIYPHALSKDAISATYGTAALQLDFASNTDLSVGTNSVTCVTAYCPQNGTFDQTRSLTVTGAVTNLNIGDGFTFATWINPQQRTTPFNTGLAGAFSDYKNISIDATHDWQGIFGYEDYVDLNNKRVFPTLYLSDAGALRFRMGNGEICDVQTAPGRVAFDRWQHLTVTFHNGVLTVYIDGKEVESVPGCSSQVPTVSHFFVGRPNQRGYVYFDHLRAVKISEDAPPTLKARLNYDGDTSDHNIYSRNIDVHPALRDIDVARVFIDDASHPFRLYDDQGGIADAYNSSHDTSVVYRADLNNRTSLGEHTDYGTDCSGTDCGYWGVYLYWSLYNDFYQGQLDDFRVYPNLLAADAVAALYQSTSVGLDLTFDEPPGQDLFVDESGNGFEATCAWLAQSCPDSGIPGRNNQALRFDGVNDFLTLSADSTSLGLYDSSFTVMAWVKADNLSGERAILGNDSGGDFANLMLSLENGRPRMAFGGSGSTATAVSALSAGQWHHVAFRYDKHARQQVLFVDGQQVGSSGGRNAYVGTNPILVGRARGGSYFDGLIDDLVIAKQALDVSAIQAVMNRAPLVTLHLDEDLATTTFVDDSPGRHNAICSGDACPKGGSKGQIREAVRFDGVDDMLTIPDQDSLDLTRFTIALWVKPDHTKPAYQPLISKQHNGGQRNFALWISPNNMRIHYSLNHSNCTDHTASGSSGSLLMGQWNHVALTFDGAHLTLYLNGSPSGSLAYSGDPCLNNEPIRIGYESSPGFTAFAGSLDEITITANAFSASQVRALYDYQSAWYDTTVSKLITVDADSPQVAFEHDGQYLPLAPATLWLHATDATSPIANVTVSYTGPNGAAGTITPQLGHNSDSLWYVDFAPTGAGSYHFQVTATDSVGHTSSTSGVVHVDATPPVLSLAAELNGATFGNGEVVTLSGSVSDPGQPTSGVVTNTLVVDLRDTNGVSLSGLQHATVTGDSWQAEFPLSAGIYGNYTVWASVADGVGNLYSATIGALLLDDLAPLAGAISVPDIITQTGTIISGQVTDPTEPSSNAINAAQATSATGVKSVQLRFRHASGSVWPQLDPSIIEHVVFYAPLDVRPFTDLTVYNREITTWGDGEVHLTEGRFGGAVLLDGATSLTIPHDDALDFGNGSFSVAAWVFHEDQESFNNIVSKKDYFGVIPGWVLRFNGNHASFMVADGSKQLEIKSVGPVSVREWHHLIGVVDAENRELRLYLDGQLAARGDWSSTIHTTAPLQIGSWDDPLNPDFFEGKIDDVVIFNRALNPAEALLLAQAETWQPVTLAAANAPATAWQYELTAAMEGPYKIDLWTEDAVGNGRYIPNVWSGEVDTLAPRVALGYLLSVDKRSVQVTCAAADYNLTLDGWVCPVSDDNLARHNKDAHWFTTIFSDTQKLAGLSTGVAVFTPGPGISMTACDSYGHCTTLAPIDTDGDGIPDHVEGEGDRDGDGILDAHDYDPDGHFYELGTGRILPGGRIEVSGPAPVQIGRDGSEGYYEWTTAVAGVYTLQVTPPRGYAVSPDCPAQPGPLNDAADDPLFLGASEFGNTGLLVDGSCAANPYYLSFDMEPGVGFFFNNNIPLTHVDLVGLEPQSLLPLIMNDGYSPVMPANARGQGEETETSPAAPVDQPDPIKKSPQEGAPADSPGVDPQTGENKLQTEISEENSGEGSKSEDQAADDSSVYKDLSMVQQEGDAEDRSTKGATLQPQSEQENLIFLPIIARATGAER